MIIFIIDTFVLQNFDGLAQERRNFQCVSNVVTSFLHWPTEMKFLNLLARV